MPPHLKLLSRKENFLGLEPFFSTLDNAPFLIIPAPFEKSTSYGKGTAGAPGKILAASQQIEFFDEELTEEPCLRGIATLSPLDFASRSSDESVSLIGDYVSAAAERGKVPVLLGGEHTVTVGAVKGLMKTGKDFSVLQFDAHSDFRDHYEGNHLSHASVMRRVWEYQKSVTLCGIRSQCSEEREFIAAHDIPIFYAHEMHAMSSWEIIIDRLLPDIYITFDCDFFDPSIMPAVGTPEPGGFLWSETLKFLSLLSKVRTIIGFDIVELAPRPTLVYADFTAARLTYKTIGYMGKANEEKYPLLSQD